MQKPDKHVLYQLSVQNPSHETSFLRRVFFRERGRPARRLREDFCGTGLLACEWVRRVRDGTSVGLDLDEETLEWGRVHNIASLGSRASRVQLLRCDVLEARGFRPEVVTAFNFSYFTFRSRDLLRRYFARVRRTLAADGIFVLDLYGGPEAQVLQVESRTVEENGLSFRYVWDQASYNPITGEVLCFIHFDFSDGTRMKRAFTYDWRLWSLPEVTDILEEAGFSRVDVYWEGTDHDTGGGNGIFRRSRRGDQARSWIVYIVAVK